VLLHTCTLTSAQINVQMFCFVASDESRKAHRPGAPSSARSGRGTRGPAPCAPPAPRRPTPPSRPACAGAAPTAAPPPRGTPARRWGRGTAPSTGCRAGNNVRINYDQVQLRSDLQTRKTRQQGDHAAGCADRETVHALCCRNYNTETVQRTTTQALAGRAHTRSPRSSAVFHDHIGRDDRQTGTHSVGGWLARRRGAKRSRCADGSRRSSGSRASSAAAQLSAWMPANVPRRWSARFWTPVSSCGGGKGTGSG